MNNYLALSLCLIVALCVSFSHGATTKFSTAYDNTDIDSILHNDKLMTMYFNCMMDLGKCPPDAVEMKKLLPEAIKSKCEPCSEKQKEAANKAVKYLFTEKPEMWAKLEEKFDPDHTYRNLYKEEAAKAGITI